MNDHGRKMLDALAALDETTTILVTALDTQDTDKAHEAVTVLLLQGMTQFGHTHPAMQQFFPVWDAITTHIDGANLQLAFGQAQVWQTQLHEVMTIVRNS